jgi:hypothetical protein
MSSGMLLQYCAASRWLPVQAYGCKTSKKASYVVIAAFDVLRCTYGHHWASLAHRRAGGMAGSGGAIRLTHSRSCGT